MSNFFKRQEEEKGYIVKTGSNENGSWIKFSDGTMICYGIVTVESNTQYKIVTYPQQFKDTLIIINITNGYSFAKNIHWSVSDKGITTARFYPDVNGNVITTNAVANYIAIGRWK